MNTATNTTAPKQYGYVLVLDRHGDLLARYTVGAEDPADAEGYVDRIAALIGYSIDPSRPGALIPDGGEDLRIEVYTERGTLWDALNCMIVTE